MSNNNLQVDPQLLLEDFDYSQYTPNNVWELQRTWARRNNTMYTCCPESFPDLTFSLELSRRRSFYSYVLVVPGIIISLLVPVMFLLTVGKAEKFILGKKNEQLTNFKFNPEYHQLIPVVFRPFVD